MLYLLHVGTTYKFFNFHVCEIRGLKLYHNIMNIFYYTFLGVFTTSVAQLIGTNQNNILEGHDSDEAIQGNNYPNINNNKLSLHKHKIKRSLQGLVETWLQPVGVALRFMGKLKTSTYILFQNTQKLGTKKAAGKTMDEEKQSSSSVSDSECLNHVKSEFELGEDIDNIDSNNIDEPINRIVGGEMVNIENFPYHVLIFAQGQYTCGGAIITDKFILSAAHCFDGSRNPKDYYVKAGVTHMDDDGQGRNGIEIFIYEKYVTFTDYDIAVLLVDEPFEFNTDVAKIELPDDDLCLNAGDNVTMTGFGQLGAELNVSKDLLAITLQLTSREKCREIYEDLTNRQICTISPVGQGICIGDSGGPMVSEGYVVGIASYVTPCAIGYPDVFTNVAYFVKWINKITSIE